MNWIRAMWVQLFAFWCHLLLQIDHWLEEEEEGVAATKEVPLSSSTEEMIDIKQEAVQEGSEKEAGSTKPRSLSRVIKVKIKTKVKVKRKLSNFPENVDDEDFIPQAVCAEDILGGSEEMESDATDGDSLSDSSDEELQNSGGSHEAVLVQSINEADEGLLEGQNVINDGLSEESTSEEWDYIEKEVVESEEEWEYQVQETAVTDDEVSDGEEVAVMAFAIRNEHGETKEPGDIGSHPATVTAAVRTSRELKAEATKHGEDEGRGMLIEDKDKPPGTTADEKQENEVEEQGEGEDDHKERFVQKEEEVEQQEEGIAQQEEQDDQEEFEQDDKMNQQEEEGEEEQEEEEEAEQQWM